MGWRHLCGHDRTGAFFHRAFTRGRQSHAYLLTGPEGIGKEKVALEVIKFANCENKGPDGACLKCSSCISIEKRNHPDFTEMYPERGTLKIDQVRKFIHRLSFQRMTGRFRCGIIYQADALTEEAANCLLKSLEEPPNRSLLILIAENSRMILKTVYSRCQHVALSLSTPNEITCFLQGKGADEKTAHTLACASMGRPGQAIREWDALRHIRELTGEVKRLLSKVAENALEGDKKTLVRSCAVIEDRINSGDFFGSFYSDTLQEISRTRNTIMRLQGKKLSREVKTLIEDLGRLENTLLQQVPLRVKAMELWKVITENTNALQLGRFFRSPGRKGETIQQWFRQELVPTMGMLELYLRDVLLWQYLGAQGEDFFWIGGFREQMIFDARAYPSQVLKRLIRLVDVFLQDMRLNIQLDLQALSLVLRMREELQYAPGSRNKV